MKIIADLHYYYYLGKDKDLFNKVADQPITPTLYNVLELSTTQNTHKIEDNVRDAHRTLIHFSGNMIVEPPFLYIAKHFCEIDFDVEKEYGSIFDFSSAIANGEKIDPDKIANFNAWAKDMRSNAVFIAGKINEELEVIRPNIKNKNEHRKKDTTQITLKLISSLVETASKGKCDLYDKDASQFELLIKTWDYFFKELELSKRKMKPNDVVDLLMLAYVNPGDKFWTNEDFWIEMIVKGGMEEYLFKI